MKEFGLDNKTADKTKNQFVAGILYFLFNRDLSIGENFLEQKFKKKPELIKANRAVLHAGYSYAETIEAFSTTFLVNPAKNKTGTFPEYLGKYGNGLGFAGRLGESRDVDCSWDPIPSPRHQRSFRSSPTGKA